MPTNAIGYNLNHEMAMAKPLYMQRLEASLNIDPFMAYAQEVLSQPLSSGEDSDTDVNTDLLAPDEKAVNGIVTTKCDRQNDKLQIYNLSQIGPDRKWLQDILLSDTETDPEPSDEDEYIRDMLKEHVKEKKIRAKYYQNPHVSDSHSMAILVFCSRFFITEFTVRLLWSEYPVKCGHVP